MFAMKKFQTALYMMPLVKSAPLVEQGFTLKMTIASSKIEIIAKPSLPIRIIALFAKPGIMLIQIFVNLKTLLNVPLTQQTPILAQLVKKVLFLMQLPHQLVLF